MSIDKFNYDQHEFNLDMIIKQAQETKENIKAMKEMQLEVRKNSENVMKVGRFMVDFYNEYREHDALTLAQVKELKEAQHDKTSEITRILCPRLKEGRKRGDVYLKEWNRVNKGLWSIFKTKVNGVSIPYDRTPKNKFKQAIEYLNSLSVGDYLAYRDERWGDVRDFNYIEELAEEKLTIQKIVGMENNDDDSNDDDSGTSLMLKH